MIKAGGNAYPLPRASAAFDVNYDFKGAKWTTDTFMKENRLAGLLVIKDGKIVLERYGLGRTAQDRWTSFSVGKSVTSTLIGAAIEDGYLKSCQQASNFDLVRIARLSTTTVGSSTVGACSRSRSPPDYEFATDRRSPPAIHPEIVSPKHRLQPAIAQATSSSA